MAQEIVVDAKMREEDIVPFHALRGKTNSSPITLGDVTYPVGSIRFDKYACGQDLKSGLFVGKFFYTFLPDGENESADISVIKSVEDAKPAEPEVKAEPVKPEPAKPEPVAPAKSVATPVAAADPTPPSAPAAS